MTRQGRPNILLAASGSVATIKLPELIKQLSDIGEVKVVLTKSAKNFVAPGAPGAYANIQVYEDEEEWRTWTEVGDPVVHIELRRWADILVIAPLSANTLAKVALGLCDNLLTCVARAWDLSSAPLLVAPAMNTLMWTHHVTALHLATLRDAGVTLIPPVRKVLACGDAGMGAMASPDDIAAAVRAALEKSSARAVNAFDAPEGGDEGLSDQRSEGVDDGRSVKPVLDPSLRRGLDEGGREEVQANTVLRCGAGRTGAELALLLGGQGAQREGENARAGDIARKGGAKLALIAADSALDKSVTHEKVHGRRFGLATVLTCILQRGASLAGCTARGAAWGLGIGAGLVAARGASRLLESKETGACS